MRCNLNENYSNQALKSLFTRLKNKYFSPEDISDKLVVNVSFGDVSRPLLDVAETAIDEKQIENLKDGKKATCSVTFNKEVEFNRDVLIEAILHELVHLYQLSQDPEMYKFINHNKLFLDKLYEVSKKANINIRVNLSPLDVASQKEIDAVVKELIKDVHVIVINPNSSKLLYAIVPDKVLFKIYEYARLKYNTRNIEITDVVNKRQALRNIPNILGLRDCDIYENYINLDELIKRKELELCVSELDVSE